MPVASCPVGSVREPVRHRLGRAGPRAVAVALTAWSSSPAPQAEPFDLRWLLATVTASPVASSVKVWASTGRLRWSSNRGSTELSRIAKSPAGATVRRLVDEGQLDLVGADRRRCRGSRRPSSPSSVLTASTSAAAAWSLTAVVLDLDEADDVGVHPDDRVDDLLGLAVELRRRDGATCGREARGRRRVVADEVAVTVEVVEDVEAATVSVPPTSGGVSGRGRVRLVRNSSVNSSMSTGCRRHCAEREVQDRRDVADWSPMRRVSPGSTYGQRVEVLAASARRRGRCCWPRWRRRMAS